MPDMGINMPDMGKNASTSRISEAAARYASASLSDALFTATQRRVLARLFDGQHRSYSVSELIQSTGAGSGAVQREVARLAGSGLLSVDLIGKQKRYRANPESPIHDELTAIVRKTFGLGGPIREALQPLSQRIRAAFVFGSVAKGEDTAGSDIDLLVVSDDLGYPDVMVVLHPLMEQLGREINPTIYSSAEWSQRMALGNNFVTRIMEQPRIWLIGGEHELAA